MWVDLADHGQHRGRHGRLEHPLGVRHEESGGGDGGLMTLLGSLIPGSDQLRQPGGLEAHARVSGGDQGAGGRRDGQIAPAADIGARLDDQAQVR